MHFSQKALIYNRADFEFGEKKLDVKIDDGRLVVGFSVPYHEIGTKRSIKSFPEKAVLRFGLAMLMGVIAAFSLVRDDITETDALVFCIFAVLGLIFCLASYYAKFDATKIPIASGNTILVFHDSEHHLIINEIYKRRKSEILRLYGEVDMLNLPQLELKKFLWLKEEGLVSDVEFDEARLKIDALAKKKPGAE